MEPCTYDRAGMVADMVAKMAITGTGMFLEVHCCALSCKDTNRAMRRCRHRQLLKRRANGKSHAGVDFKAIAWNHRCGG